MTAVLAALAAPARAWKPITHVHLAQEAWEDAKDGRGTLHRVEIGTVARQLSLAQHAIDLAERRVYVAPASGTGRHVAKQAAPLGELRKLANTYRAPVSVAAPATVVVTGVAQDGTGRQLTARIQIVPRGEP